MCPLRAKDLKRIFTELDKNGDGFLSLEELNWLLERVNVQLTLKELDSFVGKQLLNFDEFSVFFHDTICSSEKKKKSSSSTDVVRADDHDEEEVESDLVKAFKVFDMNDDGFISCEELQNVLERLGLWVWDEINGREHCRNMIQRFDTNLDGQLDFQEFKNMMFLSIS